MVKWTGISWCAYAPVMRPFTVYGAVLEDHEIVGGPYNNISGPVYRTGGMGEGLVGEGIPDTGGYPRAPSRHLPPRR